MPVKVGVPFTEGEEAPALAPGEAHNFEHTAFGPAPAVAAEPAGTVAGAPAPMEMPVGEIDYDYLDYRP